MPKDTTRIELLQGTLDLLILRTLVFGAAHGHAIAKLIRRRRKTCSRWKPVRSTRRSTGWRPRDGSPPRGRSRTRESGRSYYRAHPVGPEAARRRAVEMGTVVDRHGAGVAARRVGTVMLRQFGARLRSLWNRDRQESELDEEIQFHLSEEADERAAAGLTVGSGATRGEEGLRQRHADPRGDAGGLGLGVRRAADPGRSLCPAGPCGVTPASRRWRY